MSPLEIDILLHYYSRTNEHDIVYENPPIWKDLREWFLNEGLLELIRSGDASYKVTERGRVMCEALCDLQLPVARWEVSK